MRRLLALVSAALLASPATALTAPATPPPAWTSNVTYLGTIPLDGDAPGGRLVGKTFYVLTAKGVTTYDVSTPEIPVPMGFLPLPHTPNQEREDVDTNGRILVAGQSYVGKLYVADVSNPRLPVLLSTLDRVAGHTNTCVLDCTWVYSSDGAIVDLRDPRKPRHAGDWRAAAGVGGSHDLTEVRPGLLVAASNPVVYLDARRDPARPRRIGASAGAPTGRYMHGTHWPRTGKDRFVLVGSESFYGCTEPKDGAFMVLDAAAYARTGRFAYVGDFWLDYGLPTDGGRNRASALCGHWFSPHPSFANGGIVAMAWYGFGTRFLEVTPKGEVVERGWFLGGGQASAAYWVTDEIVYSLDYVRGLDILRFDRTAAAQPSPYGRWTPAGAAPRDDRPDPARPERFWVCPLG